MSDVKLDETVIPKSIFGVRAFSSKVKKIVDGFSPENYDFVLTVLKQVISLAEFAPEREVYYRLQFPPGQEIIRERSLLQKFEKQGLWKNLGEDGLGTATFVNIKLSLIRDIIGRIEEKQSGVIISSEEFEQIKHEHEHPEFTDKKPTPISSEEKEIDDWLNSKDDRTLGRYSRVVTALNYEWQLRDTDTFRIPHDKFERQKITNTNDQEAILTTLHNKKFIFVSRKIAEQPPSNDPNKPGGMQMWQVITEDPSIIRLGDTQIKIIPKRFIYLKDALKNKRSSEENDQRTESETIDKQIAELAVDPTVIPPIHYGPSVTSLNKKDTQESIITNKSPVIPNSKLEFYPDDGIADYRGKQQPFKGKARALLALLFSNKNTPYSLEEIMEKCNPNIPQTGHHFKKDKDARDCVNYIKKKLIVNLSEWFPIQKRNGNWIWIEK